MATPVHPHHLRDFLEEALHAPTSEAIVEYYHGARDPDTARAVDKVARHLARRPDAAAAARVARVDISRDARGALDKLNVRILPQPSTVVGYAHGGRARWAHAGPLHSSAQLLEQLSFSASSSAASN